MPNVTVADSPLRELVLTALEADPHVRHRKLRFEASDAGEVTLRGRVDSYFQKQMAQEALRRVAGVRQIQNELEVAW